MKQGIIGVLVAILLLSSASAESDLAGVWKLERLSAEPHVLSDAGQQKMDAYNYMTDDPATRCSPASFTRIVFTPQTYLEIRVLSEAIEIHYEFLDVKRRVSLDPTLTTSTAGPSVPDHPHLGRSVARFEDDELIIETDGYEAGVVTTLNQRAGLPRSKDMWTEERFSVDGDELTITLTHIDPIYYEGPLIMTVVYARTDEELLEFGCDLDDADHYNE